jgi:hypothetical protein
MFKNFKIWIYKYVEILNKKKYILSIYILKFEKGICSDNVK